MPSLVSYQGKKLQPAPFLSIEKQYDRAADGSIIGKRYLISVQATLVAFKGSPNSSGIFHTSSGYPDDEVIADDARLGSIIRKQEAIRTLFSVDGALFEVQSADGTTPLSFNPRILSLSFPEGLWYQTCPYTVQMEADVINGLNDENEDFTDKIVSASENWEIEYGDTDDTFRVTHTVQAVGKRFYNESGTLIKEAWEHAQTFVLARIGYDATKIGFASGTPRNYVKAQSIGELDGSFSITEGWILATTAALEDYSVIVVTSAETGLTEISVEGTITGLSNSTSVIGLATQKFSNAVAYFASINPLTRAQTYAGSISPTLNATALSTSVGRNPTTGVITYQYTYNNRPSNLIPNSLTESIEVTDINQGDVIAEILVLGRTLGPVLQDIGTKTAKHRTISIQAAFVPIAGSLVSRLAAKPDTSSIIDALSTSINSVTLKAKIQDQESWDPGTGRYSRQVDYLYE